MPPGTCAALMNVLATSDSFVVAAPDFPIVDFLAPILLSLEATTLPATAAAAREAWPSNWLLTPEVSLGPAYRSLAPPLLEG
jgi:hypothetical protein